MFDFKLRHPTLSGWSHVPVEDAKGVWLAEAQGECEGATPPGGWGLVGALPEMQVFPLKKKTRERLMMS